MLFQLRKNMGVTWKLPLSVLSTLVETSCSRVPALSGLGAVHVHLQRGIVERLLDAKVGEAGNLAQLGENLVGLGLAGVRHRCLQSGCRWARAIRS